MDQTQQLDDLVKKPCPNSVSLMQHRCIAPANTRINKPFFIKEGYIYGRKYSRIKSKAQTVVQKSKRDIELLFLEWL